MKRGEVLGGWLPEPWSTRLVLERGARRLIDERDLWEGGRFAAALVVARADVLSARGPDIARFVAALQLEIARAREERTSVAETQSALRHLTARTVPLPVLEQAWQYVDFTSEPLPESVARFASDAAALGLVPPVECAPLFAA